MRRRGRTGCTRDSRAWVRRRGRELGRRTGRSDVQVCVIKHGGLDLDLGWRALAALRGDAERNATNVGWAAGLQIGKAQIADADGLRAKEHSAHHLAAFWAGNRHGRGSITWLAPGADAAHLLRAHRRLAQHAEAAAVGGRQATHPTSEFDVGAARFRHTVRYIPLALVLGAGGLGDAVQAGAGGNGNLRGRRH